MPNTAGVKQGDNMAPLLFIFVMQACLETLGDTWPVGKPEFRTNTRTTGVCGGKVSGTDWTNKGEFSFEIWCSLYADDAGVMCSSRADLVAGAEAIDAHLKLFGLLVHVGRAGENAPRPKQSSSTSATAAKKTATRPTSRLPAVGRSASRPSSPTAGR